MSLSTPFAPKAESIETEDVEACREMLRRIATGHHALAEAPLAGAFSVTEKDRQCFLQVLYILKQESDEFYRLSDAEKCLAPSHVLSPLP